MRKSLAEKLPKGVNVIEQWQQQRRHLVLPYHKLLEHFVVVSSCEHELARVQLEQAHAHRP
jgi:hypothetical protein